MAKDEKGKSPPDEPSPPITAQEFADALTRLSGNAQDASVRTAKAMVAAGVGELLKVLNGVLEGLEGDKKDKPKGPSGA